MTDQSWTARVESYVDELQQIAAAVDHSLSQTRLETTAADAAEVESSMQALVQLLRQLELQIAEREELLKADDAPVFGITLTEKLQNTRRTEDARLAKRCLDVAEQITDAHRRAVAVFVCQYHLADLSSEIIRLIAGKSAPATYDPSQRTDIVGGGSLFSESA